MKKFVCLEHLDTGDKFFTSSRDETPDSIIRDNQNTVRFKFLKDCDTVEEAQMFLYGKVYK